MAAKSHVTNTVGLAAIYYVEHAANGDVQYQLGLAIEEFSAVHVGQVQQGINALSCLADSRSVTNIGLNELNIACDIGQTADGAARVII